MNNNTRKILKKLQKEYRRSNGNFILYIYEEGSQHIDHVDNQYIYTNTPKPQATTDINEGSDIPDALNTEQAKVLWKKAQDAGWVDENYQPLISRTLAALLADSMAKRLGIKNKWKIFGALWNRNNMRGDYNDALSQRQTLAFQDSLKMLLVD